MGEMPCLLVNYLYRRTRFPGSVTWHLNCHQLSDAVVTRSPGLVEHAGNANEARFIFAVPCSAKGKISLETQDEYEKLADERFLELYPGHQLA